MENCGNNGTFAEREKLPPPTRRRLLLLRLFFYIPRNLPFWSWKLRGCLAHNAAIKGRSCLRVAESPRPRKHHLIYHLYIRGIPTTPPLHSLEVAQIRCQIAVFKLTNFHFGPLHFPLAI